MAPVTALMQRISITEMPELEERYPGKFVADVTLRFRDGTSEHVFVEDPIGSFANPMTEAVQDAKFMELTRDVLGDDRARALLATLRELPRQASAADLMALCTA